MNHESTLLSIQNMYGCHLSHEKWMLKAAISWAIYMGQFSKEEKKQLPHTIVKFVTPSIYTQARSTMYFRHLMTPKKKEITLTQNIHLFAFFSFFVILAYLLHLLLTSIVKKWIEYVLLVAYKMRWKEEERNFH